jgi:hypothetical protein
MSVLSVWIGKEELAVGPMGHLQLFCDRTQYGANNSKISQEALAKFFGKIPDHIEGVVVRCPRFVVADNNNHLAPTKEDIPNSKCRIYIPNGGYLGTPSGLPSRKMQCSECQLTEVYTSIKMCYTGVDLPVCTFNKRFAAEI